MDTTQKHRSRPNAMPSHKTDESSDCSEVLTPFALQKQYQQEPWYDELNKLGLHWQSKSSAGNSVWLAQCQQACIWTYYAIWANGASLFAHRSDADAIVDKAMEYLKRDIASYDPQKSPLGDRISSKVGPRIKDALAFHTHSRNHDAWADQLTLLQGSHPSDPDKRSAWVGKVVKETFHFYIKRIDSIASKPEVRAGVRQQLQDMLLNFDPDSQSLHALVEQWVKNALHGDQKDVTLSSLDVPVGEEAESTVGELIPDQRNDPATIVEDANTFSIILAALVTNFQHHMGNGSRKKKALYTRLNYTEQLSYFAQTLPLPDSHRQDILKPLHEDYFRYFMAVPPHTVLTLRIIERATIRPVIGTDPYRLENVLWNKHGFLPAKSQMGYLHEIGVSSSDSSVSEHRNPYREGFLQLLEGMR